jgi:hypothetical protein
MSSRFHNKFHRHNHHTTSNNDSRYPDASHDPIASPDAPFQGTFVTAGGLSAVMLSAAGGIFEEIQTKIDFIGDVEISSSEIETTSTFLKIKINGGYRYIRLWSIR